MSYSSTGTMYATAGLGVVTPTDLRSRLAPLNYAPPWRPRGFHSFQGLGAYDTPTPLSVTVLQRGLHAAHASPPPGIVDGAWGPATRASLSAWLTANAGQHRLSASRVRDSFSALRTGSRSVTLPNALASRLEQLSGGYRAPSGGSHTTSGGSRTTTSGGSRTTTNDSGGGSSSEPGTSDDGSGKGGGAADGGFALPTWTPYAVGGAALLGLGAFFLVQGKRARRPAKRAPVAANRRRRRSSRRRR